MRARAAVWLVVLAACKLGASFDGRFRCSETSPCPPGRTCLDGYCEAEVPTDGGLPEPAVLGDVLMFTFDDVGFGVLRDRSGNRFDCSYGGVVIDEGVYGSGIHTDMNDFLVVPDQAGLFVGDRLTIEAWLYRDAAGELDPIIGDLSIDQEAAAEWSLEVTAEDRLRFVTNHACVADAVASAQSSAEMPVPAARWVHVAVAWDGVDARFYLDGDPAGGEALDAEPCELTRSPRLGRLSGDSELRTMIGRLDEVKVSSIAKSERDIRASMAFDSTTLVARCGDRIVEGEACDGDSPCCDADSCEAAGDGESCGPGSTDVCQAGVCAVNRVRATGSLVALYEFDEGGGTVVTDSSGVAPQVDLTIADPAAVSWGDGHLQLTDRTIVSSASAATKVIAACVASGELTIDAWVEPTVAVQSGQILAMGDGTTTNMALAQYGSTFQGRVRNLWTSGRGTPPVAGAAGDAALALTHLVVRRESDGTRTLFVNGRERGVNHAPGNLDGWDAHSLSLGNEPNDSDPWLGRFHRVAIYCRALTDLEVAGNYRVGPASQ